MLGLREHPLQRLLLIWSDRLEGFLDHLGREGRSHHLEQMDEPRREPVVHSVRPEDAGKYADDLGNVGKVGAEQGGVGRWSAIGGVSGGSGREALTIQ